MISIEESNSVAQKPQEITRYQNGTKVQTLQQDTGLTQASQERIFPEQLSQKSPIKSQNDKLWPIFIFDVKNRILLDSTVAILFDTLDATYDDDTKVCLNNKVCHAAEPIQDIRQIVWHGKN